MARRGQKGADNVSIFGPGQWLQGFVLFVIIDQARQNNACLCFYVCVAYINQSLFFFFLKLLFCLHRCARESVFATRFW